MARRVGLLAAAALCGATAAPLGPTVELRGGVMMPCAHPLPCWLRTTPCSNRCSWARTLGLGSSGGCHPDPDGTEKKCSNYQAVMSAISVGYRGFHDALSYGNQAGLGAAVSDSGLPRSELFVMSMVPTYLMGYNTTLESVQASLAQMKLTYLDLVMVHHRAPVANFPRLVRPMKAFPSTPVQDGHAAWGAPACAIADPTWVTCQDETWDALLALKKQGLVRAVGVSNWEIPTIQRMIDRG